MADSTISNDDVSAVLPEGADVQIDTGSKGGSQVTVNSNVKGMEITTTGGKTGVVGEKVQKTTISAKSSKGDVDKIVVQTEGLYGSTIENAGKGTLDVTHNTGEFKNSTIDAGANKKRNDTVVFGNDAKVIRGTVNMGKGNDTIRFKKNATFQKKTTVDLGKGGTDKIMVKNLDGVTGGKLNITTFTKKDTLTVGKTDFSYKDIEGGADIPGNIKVDLA